MWWLLFALRLRAVMVGAAALSEAHRQGCLCHLRMLAVMVGAAVLLAGCGPAGNTPPEPEAETESLRGEDADTPGVRFRVTLEGGEHAGSYELESYDPQPCQIGMLGENLFTVNASGRAPSLQYAETRIPDFQSGGGETDTFAFTAMTPEFNFRIDTTPGALRPGGSGLATYTGDGADDIQIRVSGESDDGVKVEATVDCERVGR